MVILPINSVINPLLYDDAVTKVFLAPIQASLSRVYNSEIFRRVRDLNVSPDDTPMELPEQPARQQSIPVPIKRERRAPGLARKETGEHAVEERKCEQNEIAELQEAPGLEPRKAPRQGSKEVPGQGSKEASGQGSQEASGSKEALEQQPQKPSERESRITLEEASNQEASKRVPKRAKRQTPQELTTTSHEIGLKDIEPKARNDSLTLHISSV